MFQSMDYAEVTAGAIIGQDMAVVIDTLPYMEDTLEIRDFIEQQLKVPVRYVINTHYHADHTWGNSVFKNAMVLSSELTLTLMHEKGAPSLEEAKLRNPFFDNIELRYPEITFEKGYLGLQIGRKTLNIIPLPGHSKDGVGVLIVEDRVLFAGDLLMAIPYFVDGDIDDMINSMRSLQGEGFENIVQGHGDIILRGEVDTIIDENIEYLECVRSTVIEAHDNEYPLDAIEAADVESCGKSRILLNGSAENLHHQNMIYLYKKMYGEDPIGSEEYFVD
jgi:glyoxylase-like metal-dependent hydrolase (beta-lactamase superfamily II)